MDEKKQNQTPSQNETLFLKVGGKATLERVHRVFYDKIYAHPWLSQFFKEVPQNLIESQQTDFMSDIMGGPKNYLGKLPRPAHQHMFITEELFNLRQDLLKASLEECGLQVEAIQMWLKLDAAFKKGIVKESVADCVPRFKTDEIIVHKNPLDVKKPA